MKITEQKIAELAKQVFGTKYLCSDHNGKDCYQVDINSGRKHWVWYTNNDGELIKLYSSRNIQAIYYFLQGYLIAKTESTLTPILS